MPSWPWSARGVMSPRCDGSAQASSVHPFVRLKDHPFVPTCPPRGVAASGGQGWPQGHRSSRRAASLRAVRRNAKLGKGEDFSGLLSIRNGHPKPQAAAGNHTQ